MILRARVLAPVGCPPLADGAVAVAGRRIVQVDSWRRLRARASRPVVDLGEVVLLPGLVNAHCHLDYTDMGGQIPPPRSFTDWVKVLASFKAHWSADDYARSWRRGADMLLSHGVTAVADMEVVPKLLPRVWDSTPLRIFSFLEMTGVLSRQSPERILKQAAACIDSLSPRRGGLGLAPHAPYSTTPSLLRRVALVARRRRWPVSIHVAESAPEFQMFVERRGSMFDWLRPQRDMSDCGLGSPVQHLARLRLLGPRLMAVHVNYLAHGDAALLARHGVSVVHCPRSHAYFHHDSFPRQELVAAGVNVCLGTDSLASVHWTRGQPPRLSLLAEMQSLRRTAPDLPPHVILEMATLHGARALGLEGRLGELKPGGWADLIAIPYYGSVQEAAEAVVEYQGRVAASLVDGRWAVRPGAAA